MAEGEVNAPEIENDDPEETPGYKAPVQKSLKEIQEQDQDDESLVRYKQMLLAGAEQGAGSKELVFIIILFCGQLNVASSSSSSNMHLRHHAGFHL